MSNYVMVPREPTPAMLAALFRGYVTRGEAQTNP
jgi:hypothetical protein